MSPRAIHLRVLTESHLALEDEAVSIVAPGGLGYLGMLHNHAPLVSTVDRGRLSWRRLDGSRHSAMISSGVMEIARNTLTILTDTVTVSTDTGKELRG